MTDDNKNNPSIEARLQMVADIVTAYVSHNPVPAAGLPDIIRTVHASLGSLLESEPARETTAQKPAVPIKKSITDDYIICLEDGKHLKMLKRYLRTRYGLSPEEYRTKWGLAADYPMVAPSYAERRSQFAKSIGLGRSRKKG